MDLEKTKRKIQKIISEITGETIGYDVLLGEVVEQSQWFRLNDRLDCEVGFYEATISANSQSTINGLTDELKDYEDGENMRAENMRNNFADDD